MTIPYEMLFSHEFHMTRNAHEIQKLITGEFTIRQFYLCNLLGKLPLFKSDCHKVFITESFISWFHSIETQTSSLSLSFFVAFYETTSATREVGMDFGGDGWISKAPTNFSFMPDGISLLSWWTFTKPSPDMQVNTLKK